MIENFKTNKYFNDAILGNNEITASINRHGKLLRLFYPSPDFKQLINFIDIAFNINDQRLYITHDDIGSTYTQHFVENTNILKTEIFNPDIGIRIVQTDFAPIDENLLIRRYTFTNETENEVNLRPIINSSIVTTMNNEASGWITEDSLIQYTHDYSLAIFSKGQIVNRKIYNTGGFDNLLEKTSEYIGLSSTSAIMYENILLKPGETSEFPIYIYINDNKKKNIMRDLPLEIIRVKKINVSDRENQTKKYWEKKVKKHTKHDLSKLSPKFRNIYTRTILLFELLRNSNTGGVSAALEIDENKTKSGRYSFNWPRDVYYVLKAYNILGMEKYSEQFLTNFAKITQSRSGRWEQRFYTDGTLAPSWGYQIDETAIMIIMAYEHYLHTKDKTFLKQVLPMLQNAFKYLEKYVEDVLNGVDTKTFDLWENVEEDTIYGVTSVFYAIKVMKEIFEELKEEYSENRLKVEQMNRQIRTILPTLEKLKKHILENYYSEERGSFVRNKKENKIDISLLSLVTPFKIISPNENKMQNTLSVIDMTLKTYTGGYIRYENDGYLGGYNPWSLANLWMALFNLEQKEYDKALENFNFVVNTATDLGYIAEQINNETLKAEWVIGLGWAHGMYITILDKLIAENLI